MLTPYPAAKWEPDWSADFIVYSLRWLDGKPCPYKVGRTINWGYRARSHKRWRSEFVVLRFWPVADRDAMLRLEYEALEVGRKHAAGGIGPECFEWLDPKKALRDLDRWAAGKGLTNVGPALKWQEKK